MITWQRFSLLLLVLGLTAAGARAAAKLDLGPWPAGASPVEVGQRVAANFLARPYQLQGQHRVIHYVETCTWMGALSLAQLTNDKALTARLVERFEPLFGPAQGLIPPALNVDYAVFGALPFELFIQTGDQRYLPLGLELAEQQWTTPADESKLSPEAREAVAAGLSWHTRYWIDDMYMITMLQTQAARATGDRKYLDRAAAEAVSYLGKLQQPNGLFYHAPDVPFFWARGNGWFAAGMAELLRSLPEDHPDRAPILDSYRKMMAALLKDQNEDGMWHQLIDDHASFRETSGTAMFTFAFVTGVKHGWLDAETYGPAARKGWIALVSHLNPDGRIRDVCSGLNKKNDRQHYLEAVRIVGDLHGQAPLLWCVAALLR